jgi:FtsH-binding integral membrane protein
MAQYDNRYAQGGTARPGVAGTDEGLRAYMLQVYNYMAGGLALTGIVAYVTYSMAVTGSGAAPALTPLGQVLYASPLKWVIMLAPLAFVFFLSFRVNQMSLGAAQVSFWLFAAVMGLSLSTIFLVFTGESITRVFFITAAAFGGLSLYGYTTKKDMSG